MSYSEMASDQLQALPLNEAETSFQDLSCDVSSFIPEPWMIKAYFESPKSIPAHEKKQLSAYIEAHPLISKSYHEIKARSDAQNKIIRSMIAKK